MKQQLLTMTHQEVSRYAVIKKLLAGRINGTVAAKQISLTVRQVKNIKAKVMKEGVRGVMHQHRLEKGVRYPFQKARLM